MTETSKTKEIKRKYAHRLWWAAFFAAMALVLASLPGYMKELIKVEPTSGLATIQMTAKWIATLLSVSSVVLCLALALLVMRRKPDESISLFLSYFLMVYGILMAGPLEHFLIYWLPQAIELALLLPSIIFLPVAISLLLVFPNGRFIPRWTRWLVVFTWLLTVILFLTLSQDEWLRMTTTRARVGTALWGILLLLAIGVQLYRYKRIYSLVERQQTKWVLIGIFAAYMLAGILSIPYYYSFNLPPGVGQLWWEPLGSAGWWFTMMIFPLSLTIAILRYRLWDIDILIRRTLVYAALTATLALVFFSGVALLQQVLGRISGTENSPVAIVLSTLAIAALFSPLRRRIQDFIDRRFYRQKYNAEQALEAFAETARNETDLDALSSKLVEVVSQTMRPEQVSLWVKPTSERKPKPMSGNDRRSGVGDALTGVGR